MKRQNKANRLPRTHTKPRQWAPLPMPWFHEISMPSPAEREALIEKHGEKLAAIHAQTLAQVEALGLTFGVLVAFDFHHGSGSGRSQTGRNGTGRNGTGRNGTGRNGTGR